jgi:hypothetical protein
MSSAQTLDVLTGLMPAEPKARWLDVACGMVEEAGLEFEEERPVSIEIDYEDWLARGSAGRAPAH